MRKSPNTATRKGAHEFSGVLTGPVLRTRSSLSDNWSHFPSPVVADPLPPPLKKKKKKKKKGYFFFKYFPDFVSVCFCNHWCEGGWGRYGCGRSSCGLEPYRWSLGRGFGSYFSKLSFWIQLWTPIVELFLPVFLSKKMGFIIIDIILRCFLIHFVVLGVVPNQ